MQNTHKSDFAFRAKIVQCIIIIGQMEKAWVSSQ